MFCPVQRQKCMETHFQKKIPLQRAKRSAGKKYLNKYWQWKKKEWVHFYNSKRIIAILSFVPLTLKCSFTYMHGRISPRISTHYISQRQEITNLPEFGYTSWLMAHPTWLLKVSLKITPKHTKNSNDYLLKTLFTPLTTDQFSRPAAVTRSMSTHSDTRSFLISAYKIRAHPYNKSLGITLISCLQTQL